MVLGAAAPIQTSRTTTVRTLIAFRFHLVPGFYASSTESQCLHHIAPIIVIFNRIFPLLTDYSPPIPALRTPSSPEEMENTGSSQHAGFSSDQRSH